MFFFNSNNSSIDPKELKVKSRPSPLFFLKGKNLFFGRGKSTKNISSQSLLLLFSVVLFFFGSSFCIFTSKFSFASGRSDRRVSCQTLRFSARPKVALPPLLPFLPSKRSEVICSQVTKNLGYCFFGEFLLQLWRVCICYFL